MAPRIIEVIPNPYIALDADGIPQGVVGAGASGRFIGAHADLLASGRTGKHRFYFPLGERGKLSTPVYFSADIVTAVLAGELLVTTKEDARICGISEENFLEPERALAVERGKALAYYQSLHGVSAKVAEIPRTPEEAEEDGKFKTASSSEQITPTVKLTKNTEA